MGAVIAFSGRSVTSRVLPPAQLELFGNRNVSGVITFVDNDALAPDALLRIISRNSIRTILDWRKGKLFSPYVSEHKFVSDYIEEHRLTYVDLSECVSEQDVSEGIGKVKPFVESGLCMVLFRSSEQMFNIGYMRWAMFNLGGAKAEISEKYL